MNNRVIADDERYIKFRAWFNGKMEYSHAMPDLDFWNRNNDRFKCEYMQYVGRRDCRGREIYEGDVVKYYSHFECETRVYENELKADVEYLFTDAYGTKTYERYNALMGVVRWNNEYQAYEPIIIDSEYGYRFSFIMECNPESSDEDGYPKSYYEVIGNIYETPSLIPQILNPDKI